MQAQAGADLRRRRWLPQVPSPTRLGVKRFQFVDIAGASKVEANSFQKFRLTSDKLARGVNDGTL